MILCDYSHILQSIKRCVSSTLSYFAPPFNQTSARLKKQLFIIASLILASTVLSAQDAPGARATGLGGSAVVLDDVWSGFHNQAGLVNLQGFAAGVFYENRFSLNELATRGAIVALPYGNNAFSLSYKSFGYSAFSSSRASLGYALKMSDKFSGGVQINYHAIRIGENYGSQQTFSFEGGFQYKMTTKLTLGGHIYNPTRAKIADFNDERIASILRIGAGYKFSDKLQLLGEVRKASDADAGIRLGIEYRPVEQIALRGGFGSEPSMYSFGFGWILKTFQVDAAVGFHQVLGFTPQLSLTYNVVKK